MFVLWRIFTLKRDQVTGEWRRLQTPNDELYDLYHFSNIIRVITPEE